MEPGQFPGRSGTLRSDGQTLRAGERKTSRRSIARSPRPSSLQEPGRDHQKIQAQTYYLLGLIGKERPKDAVAVAKKMGKQDEVYVPQEAIKAMERAGYARALDDFFFELLSGDPTLPFWTDYVPLAAKAGQTDRM